MKTLTAILFIFFIAIISLKDVEHFNILTSLAVSGFLLNEYKKLRTKYNSIKKSKAATSDS